MKRKERKPTEKEGEKKQQLKKKERKNKIYWKNQERIKTTQKRRRER